MCEICGKWSCPPQCPNYEVVSGGRCTVCGGRLYEGEICYEMNGKLYCSECVEGATLEELVRICESDDSEELLERMGLTRGAYGGGDSYGG